MLKNLPLHQKRIIVQKAIPLDKLLAQLMETSKVVEYESDSKLNELISAINAVAETITTTNKKLKDVYAVTKDAAVSTYETKKTQAEEELVAKKEERHKTITALITKNDEEATDKRNAIQQKKLELSQAHATREIEDEQAIAKFEEETNNNELKERQQEELDKLKLDAEIELTTFKEETKTKAKQIETYLDLRSLEEKAKKAVMKAEADSVTQVKSAVSKVNTDHKHKMNLLRKELTNLDDAIATKVKEAQAREKVEEQKTQREYELELKKVDNEKLQESLTQLESALQNVAKSGRK